MSNLDTRQRDSNMPKSENMIQRAFDRYNNTGRDAMESIKITPSIAREVRQATEKYRKAKETTQAKEAQTPIVTAQDIMDEMYR